MFKWEFYSFLKYIFIYLNSTNSTAPVSLNLYMQTFFNLLILNFGLTAYVILQYWGVKCSYDIAMALSNLIKLGIIRCNTTKLANYICVYSVYAFFKDKLPV